MARPKGAKDKKPRKSRYSKEDKGEGEGMSTMALAPALHFGRLPKPTNNQEIIDRVWHFFDYCNEHDVKPGIALLGLAVGCSRAEYFRRLQGGCADAYTGSARDTLLWANAIIGGYFEQLLLNSAMHPTIAVFMAINNFGYQSVNTIKIESVDKQGQLLNAQAVRDKYQSITQHTSGNKVIEADYEDVDQKD